MSFTFPFFAFPFDWGNLGGFPGHGVSCPLDRAHNYVPTLNMWHHIPMPRCRLVCASGSLPAGSVSRSSRQRVACLQPLSNPHLPKIPNIGKHLGAQRRERSGPCWEELDWWSQKLPSLAVPICPPVLGWVAEECLHW